MNYSGSTRRNIIERKEISVRPSESEDVIKSLKHKEDEAEMKRVVELFEKTKEENPELFHKVMIKIKQIMTILSMEKCSNEDLKFLDELFTEIENVNNDFLFWCLNKGIKIAIIDNKNIQIVHFLLIKKNYKLTNKLIHKNILIEYFNSLSQVDFLDSDDENINTYMAILEILIFYANIDINEKQEGIENIPLHIAVLNKQYHFILALVKNKKCEINTKNKNGETALDFAISKYAAEQDDLLSEEIIKILVMHGAILNEENL